MNKPFILIAESDIAVKRLISIALEAQGYKFHVAETGTQAMLEAVSHKPDILLLALSLPDMDGVELINKIRSWSDMPIIVVSERSSDCDKIEALDAGADDYITKPFSPSELLARIRVSLRHLNRVQIAPGLSGSEFENGELKIDFSAGCVYLNENEIHLTPIEYKLLCLLAKNIGKVLTHAYITREIWGAVWDNDIASQRVFMASLRKKIESSPENTKYIQTHVGIGYRMLRIS